ncbi:MAG: AAA family ATPase [Patescibacteria group bacterium]
MKTSELSRVEAEVLEEYRKQVLVPAKKSKRQFLLAPVGFVGSGKSTVLRELQKKLPFVIVSADEIRKLLKERGEGYDAAHEIMFRAGEYFARQGDSVAYDTHCGRTWKKERIERLAEEISTRVFWIQVHPPEEYIIQKLRVYPHTWLFRNVAPAIENYRGHKAGDEHLALPFICTFDPSRADVEKQIEEAAERIRSGA